MQFKRIGVGGRALRAVTTASTGSTTPATMSDAPTLVGRWERRNECPQLVKAF
jgi:hypothetical protein